MFGSHVSQGRRQRRVASSQGSPNSSDGLTFINVCPRVPSVTVAYFGRRANYESDSIFEEIDFLREKLTFLTQFLEQGQVFIPLTSLKVVRRKGLKWLQVPLELSSMLHRS